ncbi:NAD-dependent epimerase/dehydratase family protein [Streptomyces sp. NBC_01750]|uniref:NAD-dependent epimerase/dehydratase family protein n=1 Tax=Streptomyces sp. NBC_01750 TaxID=2975928 RepID=UPI002DD9A5C9|nr:NAD-dependent epimerase/dehydratase family protein [Streptomyces sp. NBC_01750]WSD36824.1 GDP-mannose 4,6-dehydratase [Streptomyces sp. NBC_01750]
MEPVLAPGNRVVVAGGAGFLGSHLCAALIARGVSVECLDDLSTGRLDNIAVLVDHPRFRFRRIDISEPFDIADEVAAVLHLASPASPVDYYKLPLATLRAGSAGTWNLLRLAEAKRARFVLASTSEVYGDPKQHPQSESYWGHVNPVGPRAVYDESKRFAESLTACFRRELDVNTGIVRIFNSYGPRMRPDDGRMVPTFIRQALTGQPLTITGSGEQTRSLCFVDDTVRGLLAFTAASHSGPINIGSQDEKTVRDVADVIRELTASTVPLLFLPPSVDDPARRCPDTSLARDLLGWQTMVPLEEGLTRTAEAMATELGLPLPTRLEAGVGGR